MNIIERLAKESGLSRIDLESFLLHAPLKYKHYSIPKRSGGRRLIAQPSQELKRIQRAFLHLVDFPVHSSAIAYRQGMSIKDNAAVHKNNRYLLGMDLRNYFNSITPTIFWRLCKHHKILQGITESEHSLVSRLLFWSPSKNLSRRWVLSVGAPSSPTISNFVMYSFDALMSDYCREHQINYTRYADDLTFSTNQQGSLFNIPEVVKGLLKNNFGSALLINHKKTSYSSKAHNRHVTGITINNDAELSLGRERKRYIKGLVFRYKSKQLPIEEYGHLRGMLAFAQHIEPKFIDRLKSKYGDTVVKNIMKSGTNE